MRQETLWQGERREARQHWWRQLLEWPTGVNGEDVFDEVLGLRFRLVPEKEPVSGHDSAHAGRGCWA